MGEKEKPEGSYLKEEFPGTGTQTSIACPSRAAGRERGRQERKPHSPGAISMQQACSTLSAAQGRRNGGLDPLPRSLTLTEHCRWQPQAREGIYWGQVSRNQAWQSLWLRGFCPVLQLFTGEVSTKLFCFLMRALQCPRERRTLKVQSSPTASRRRRYVEQGTTSVTYVSW